MENYKKIILLTAFLLVLSIMNVSASLGTFALNDCVNIAVPLNATSVTLTNINSPPPNSTIVLSNQAMTDNGNLHNYTFCNTTNYGTYTYGYCDNLANCYGNSFLINGSGQDVSSSQITLIIIGLVILIIVCAFFFILSIMFKHPGTKIFLMSLSALTLIGLIGIISSNADVYLAEFPNLVNIYHTYYIVIISLAGAAMAGILLWLVYYGVTLFNKSRGRISEDD